MRNFTITVEKLTSEEVMRKACECTFLGKSKTTLLSIYKTEHSPVRTQIFWVTFDNIPLASATHLLRHHVGSVPFQLTCRDDRKGGNPDVPAKCDRIVELASKVASMDDAVARITLVDEIKQIAVDLKENSDRNTPVKLGLLINAQSLIDMAKLRICIMAHQDTREIFLALREEIALVDEDLAHMMVRKCVYRGGICGESRCCGFNNTPAFKQELTNYLSRFSDKQAGIHRKRKLSREQEIAERRQMKIDFKEC